MYQITIEAEYNMKNVSLSILRNFVVKHYFVYKLEGVLEK
jgi:hypothetical protein